MGERPYQFQRKKEKAGECSSFRRTGGSRESGRRGSGRGARFSFLGKEKKKRGQKFIPSFRRGRMKLEKRKEPFQRKSRKPEEKILFAAWYRREEERLI